METDSATLDVDTKFSLVRSVGEECVTEAELKNLLAKKPNFILYDGFEPSGRMHIAQGVFKAMNVNKCTKAGGTFVFWVADWFALMNDKMGGDLDKIKTVGKYLIEVWKAAGMDMQNVKFLWSSDEITRNADQYWSQALDIARLFTIARVKKCCQIMGRKKNSLTAAQILYPIMQCTDIFFLRADICQLGVDQRKVNMLARDYCDHAGRKLKPIILSHHMLYGLKEGQAKMSKSDPDSAIFMEDDEADIKRKLDAAYCPREPKDAEAAKTALQSEDSMRLVEDLLLNPCLDYLQHIVFCLPNATFEAGGKVYTNFETAKEDFISGVLSESDLKSALASAINKLVAPVREHFEKNPEAKELIEAIKAFKKEEASGSQVASKFRRLSVTESAKVHVVFAPLASEKFTLGDVLTLVKQLEAAKEGEEVLLWVRDWSSFCLNRLGGDKKAISSSYTLLVEATKAVAPSLMAKVRVVIQSQAILTNSSDYWISVINVGRKFHLPKVTSVDEANPQVSHVITCLMHVGDVLATGATTICCSEADRKLHQLAIDYYAEIDTSLPVPNLVIVEGISSQLRVTPPEGAEDLDIDIFLTDVVADVGRKIKRAFCESQNISYCPPLVLAREIGFRSPSGEQQEEKPQFVVKRKPEDGGDKIYTSFEELQTDFANGTLHPGDLKPVVTSAVGGMVGKIVAHCGKEPGKGAVAGVKNFIKKSQAAKKKNATSEKK